MKCLKKIVDTISLNIKIMKARILIRTSFIFIMLIVNYSNSWFRDGVNVGAYATFKLYFYYKYIGNENEAKKYKIELLDKYSNYIDYGQNYFKDILVTENK